MSRLNKDSKNEPFVRVGLVKEKPSQFVARLLHQLPGCFKVWKGTDPKQPGQFVFNIRFTDKEKAAECKQNYCNKAILSSDHKTLILNVESLENVLSKLGILSYKANEVPIMQALHKEHRQKTSPFTTSLSFYYKPEAEPLNQLIEIVSQINQVRKSFFLKSLLNFLSDLKELPLNSPTLMLIEIKNFTQSFSTHNNIDDKEDMVLINMILDAEVKGLREIIEKISAQGSILANNPNL